MSDDGRTVGGAEDGADLSRHDPVLADLDSLMPEISFDFESRGHDYDTTIDDSQDLTHDDSEMGGSVEDHGEGHTLKALFQVDNTPAVNRRPKSPSRAPVMPMAMMGESEIQSPTITEEDTVEVADRSSADRRPTRRTNFVIDFPSLTDEQRNEYVRIESKIVEAVTAEDITEAGSIYYEVQFTDGRQEMIPHDRLLSKSNGLAALKAYYNSPDMSSLGKRKRRDDEDWLSDTDAASSTNSMDADEDNGAVCSRNRTNRSHSVRSNGDRFAERRRNLRRVRDGEEEDDVSPAPRRSRRTRKPPPSAPNLDDDRDELADDPFEDEGHVPLITSDVVASAVRPSKYRRRTLHRSTSGTANQNPYGSDIEFEAPRRSSRATKYQLDMVDDSKVDEDWFLAEVDKAPIAPKAISVREIFLPIDRSSDFASKHQKSCHICKDKQRPLIYCQGCSLSFHKHCIGYRSGREHMVTKVGEGDFVLQCKFCIGLYRKKDRTAPRHNMCQTCKGKGKSCAAFSQKKTSREEEKLREQNGGIDPAASVSRDLINNAAHVLFRCIKCHRGWHTEHLPPTGRAASPAEDPSELFKDYAVDWKCNECTSAVRKIHRLVAWRPVNKDDVKPGILASQFDEDSKEYLIKWEDRSYGHCVWKPGAWIFGVCPAAMRHSFAKRDAEKSTMHLTTKDAVPEEYLMPDIILALRWSSQAPDFDTKTNELQNMGYVKKIFVKFQGLSYDDVVWDNPPTKPPGPEKLGEEETSGELQARANNIYDAMGEAFFDYIEGKYFDHASQRTIKDRVREYKRSPYKEVDQQPAGLTGGKLMGYQIEGLNWLLENYHRDRSVVLADEMGLGKTVQVVSLVASLAQDEPKCWPFLVVVPNATCPNWRREFKKWTPDLRVVTYHGGKRAQDLAYKYELFPDGSKDMRAHVVIMSYDSAADPATKSLFKSVQWQGLVVDEGQRLKNDENLLYLALKAMGIPFRLLLTGTPLQNNKRELFNLLQFIDESQDASKLDTEFEVLDKETLPKLHEKIRPYFLRRTKAGVLKFLPPMAQIILPVTMTSIQEKLSKSIMAKNPQLIKSMFANNKMKAKERGSLNNILMQLRKCLCHPFVYSDAIEERHHEPAVIHRNLVEASSKLILLETMLPKLKERGHRVLIFSQFLQQLDIIEDFLSGMNLGFRRLDGTISSLEKQRRIDAFNAPDSELFAFLLSTRAGGVGINLATADTVIIMDPDFNPHQDIQALSRAHRIGQKKKVLCFQLVTKDSVEERIMQIGRKKMALDHALIESMDDDDIAGDDLESILKHGAQALFDEDYQKDAIVYDSAAIDKIIDRTQIEKTEVTEDGSGDTQFSHARVWVNDKSAFQTSLGNEEEEAPEPQVNPNVWERILAQREEEARKEAEANQEILGRGGRRRKQAPNSYNAIASDLGPEAIDAGSDGSSDVYSGSSDVESEEDPDAAAKDDQVQASLETACLRPHTEKGSSAKTLQTDAHSAEKGNGRKTTGPKKARENSGKQRKASVGGIARRHTTRRPNLPGQDFLGLNSIYRVNQGPGHRTNRSHVPEPGERNQSNVTNLKANLSQSTYGAPLPHADYPATAHSSKTQQAQSQKHQAAFPIPGQGKHGDLRLDDLKSQTQLRLALDYVARAKTATDTKDVLKSVILKRLRDLSLQKADG